MTAARPRRRGGRLAVAWAAAAGLALAARAETAFEAGQAAWERGDFAAARAAWTEAAVDGDGEAQFALGVMLANGGGVARDVISAWAWLSLAHRNGVSGARERSELLLRDYIPRHCHYDALKLARDFEAGAPERLAAGGRQNSRCWRIR